jgi:hypothetical protein
MKVLLNTGSYAFRLHRPVLEALWESNPELFNGEPMPKEEFYGLAPAGSGRTLTDVFDWAVERNGALHFLTLFSPQLRTLPALISRAELGEELGPGLRVVNAPSWSEWHVFVFEDGKESVCENRGEVSA